MMRSMFAGVAGSRNHQLKMDIIGNNIANVNTIGYKSSRLTFQEAFAQTIKPGSVPSSDRTGGTNPAQVGLGTALRSIDVMMNQGSLENTGRLTDLAIDGEGFFVLSDGQAQKYTRDGSFDVDGDGYLVSPAAGWKVMGWSAKEGQIDKSQPIGPLRLQVGEVMTAKATDEMRYRGNLDAERTSLYDLESVRVGLTAAKQMTDAADAAVSAGYTASQVATAVHDQRANTIDPDIDAVLTAANGQLATDPASSAADVVAAAEAAATGSVGKAVAAAGAAVRDRVPNASALDVLNMLQRAADAAKAVTKQADDAAAAAAVAADATPEKVKDAVEDVLAEQTLEMTVAEASPSLWSTQTQVYDSLGVKHDVRIVFEKVDNNKWSWKAEGTGVSGEGILKFQADGSCDRDYRVQPISVEPGNGADVIDIDLDFGNVSQFGSPSTVTDSMVNGFPSGTLESFKIDPSGVITGIYSNQQNEVLGQIVVAKFTNPAGLSREGSNLFAETLNSGTANIGPADDGGRGSIISGSVEMSNVDLAKEFTDLIVTLRGFQANARLITTAEEMLQELIQLKR